MTRMKNNFKPINENTKIDFNCESEFDINKFVKQTYATFPSSTGSKVLNCPFCELGNKDYKFITLEDGRILRVTKATFEKLQEQLDKLGVDRYENIELSLVEATKNQ